VKSVQDISERESKTLGLQRHAKKQEKQSPQYRQAELIVISEVQQDVADFIRAEIESQERASSGRRMKWYDDLKGLNCDVLALRALQCAVSGAINNKPWVAVMASMGEHIYQEFLGQQFDGAEDIDHAVQKKKLFEKKTLYSRIRFVQGLLIEHTKWKTERKVTAATPLINAVLASKVFERFERTVKVNGKLKTEVRVVFSALGTASLEAHNERIEWAAAVFLPIAGKDSRGNQLKPVPWTSTKSGVYHDRKLSALVPLIRNGAEAQNTAIDALCAKRLPKFMEALNVLQNVPFAINEYVLSAVKYAWANNIVLSKFPSQTRLDLPQPVKQWGDMSRDERELFKQDRQAVKERNLQITNDVWQMRQDIDIADLLVEKQEFRLGANCDKRGRAYFVSPFNYQRGDYQKALFLLKNKQPVKDSLKWLLIHAANTGDFDKVSKRELVERQIWATMNLDWITACGKDFEANTQWHQADKPFQFLAACRELYLYTQDPDNYESGLPVAIDATNSGAQHYSAITRSQKDGALCNLVPQDKIADLYEVVAGKVTDSMSVDHCEKYQTQRQQWLAFGIGRGDVKRNVMTYFYSSKAWGMAQQLVTDTMQPLERKRLANREFEHPFGRTEWQQKSAAMYAAKHIFSAVENTVSSAAETMSYLRSCAGLLALENKPLIWKTPSEFVAHQYYSHKVGKKLKLWFFENELRLPTHKRRSVAVAEDTGKCDIHRMKNACGANVIHSLDSAHLLLTVLACQEKGINDFFVIHDSFGSTSADMEEMYATVRETFIYMYEEYCIFEVVDKSTRAVLSLANLEKMEKIPTKGDLDLKAITKSEWCFS
jgi:DNA-directed RNA polymerase